MFTVIFFHHALPPTFYMQLYNHSQFDNNSFLKIYQIVWTKSKAHCFYTKKFSSTSVGC